MGLSSDAREAMRTLDIAHAHHPFASCLAPCACTLARGVPVVFTNHTRYDLYSDTYVGVDAARGAPRGDPPLPQSAQPRAYRSRSRRPHEIAEWLAGYGVSAREAARLPQRHRHENVRAPRFAPHQGRARAGGGRLRPLLRRSDRPREERRAAARRVRTRRSPTTPDLALVLVGDGPARSECERKARREPG